MNMKLLEVVIPPYLYHVSSTWKTFWEENFTLGKFSPVNMKICGCRMLGNTERIRIVRSKSPWISHCNLLVWTK